MSFQTGIVPGVPRVARYLFLHPRPGTDPRAALVALAAESNDDLVIGLGHSLLVALGCSLSGLPPFPALVGPEASIPSTPCGLWCWLRADDRGELVHRTRKLLALLDDAFTVESMVEAFQYRESRDLSGYEDGTENPTGDKALSTAFVQGEGPGLDGSSFVAVQRWIHDLGAFDAMPTHQQDETIGRRIADNTEIDDAPKHAHVKRTAQEDFEPEAFVLRRSMPWTEGSKSGLIFVAFGHSVNAFEALMKRMLGLDDGVTDALFRFTRPETGAYFWCPPIANGRLDLTAVGL